MTSPTPGEDALEQVRRLSAQFVDERGWHDYQTPKNLSMALMVEAAELLEHFQWMSQSQSANLEAKTRQAVSTELADVLIYLVRIADVLDIDLGRAAVEKIAANHRKYPPGVSP